MSLSDKELRKYNHYWLEWECTGRQIASDVRDMAADLLEARKQIAVWKDTAAGLMQFGKDMAERAERVETELAEARKQIADWETSYRDALRKLADAIERAERAETELAEARKQIAELQTEINELAAQLEADDRENARLIERAERVETELAEACKQIAELKEQLLQNHVYAGKYEQAVREANERAERAERWRDTFDEQASGLFMEGFSLHERMRKLDNGLREIGKIVFADHGPGGFTIARERINDGGRVRNTLIRLGYGPETLKD